MPMSQNEIDDLKYAKDLLENPGLAARITDALGTAIDKGFEILPAKWSDVVQQATKESLRKALEFAVITMDERQRISSWNFLHKMLAATSGAVGGALINTIFIDHFQDMARGHFIIRRLERVYGTDEVKRQYEEL